MAKLKAVLKKPDYEDPDVQGMLRALIKKTEDEIDKEEPEIVEKMRGVCASGVKG